MTDALRAIWEESKKAMVWLRGNGHIVDPREVGVYWLYNDFSGACYKISDAELIAFAREKGWRGEG